MVGRDDLTLEKRRKVSLTRQERIILGVGIGTLGYLLLPLHDVWFVFEVILLYVLLGYELDCEPTQYRRRSWKSLSNGIEGIETSSLKVFVGSWNVGDSLPPLNAGGLSPWFTNGNEYDIYAIGAQECDFKIPKEAKNTNEDNEEEGEKEGKREGLMNLMEEKKGGVEMVWFSALQNQLKEDFVTIGFTSCRDAIRLIVFIRKELKDFVSNVEISSTLTQIPFFYRKGGNGIPFSHCSCLHIFTSHPSPHLFSLPSFLLLRYQFLSLQYLLLLHQHTSFSSPKASLSTQSRHRSHPSQPLPLFQLFSSSSNSRCTFRPHLLLW
jgi:hypothetical protein